MRDLLEALCLSIRVLVRSILIVSEFSRDNIEKSLFPK